MSGSPVYEDNRRVRVVDCWSSQDSPSLNSLPEKLDGHIRIVCISDTHGFHKRTIPNGDILIHGSFPRPASMKNPSKSHISNFDLTFSMFSAGDFTNQGKEAEIQAFVKWFGSFPHPNKIVIAGNHDYSLESGMKNIFSRVDIESDPAKALLRTVAHYLENETITICGIRFYASPYNIGHGAFAFRADHKKLESFWNAAPLDVDILITHGPPLGIQSTSRAEKDGGDQFVRDYTLRAKSHGLAAHIFGHIHESYGVSIQDSIYYINAAVSQRAAPVVLDVVVHPS